MRRVICLLAVSIFFFQSIIIAQSKAKPKQKTTSSAGHPDMNKLMEEALQKENMTEAEKAEMRKMMGSVMPALTEQNAETADYPEFESNKALVPERNNA